MTPRLDITGPDAIVATDAPVGLFLADSTQQITGANPKAIEIVEATGLTWPLHNWADLVHPDDLTAIRAALTHWTTVSTERVLTFTFRACTGTQWMRIRLSQSRAGTDTCFIGSIVDVSADITASRLLEAQCDERVGRRSDRIRNEVFETIVTTLMPTVTQLAELADAVTIATQANDFTDLHATIPLIADLARAVEHQLSTLQQHDTQ